MTGKPHAEGPEQAAAVVKRAKAAGLKIAAAESCTGGMLCAALTEISGSSAVLDRGFVTYSNEAKVEMLGVKSNTLAAHGAVSDETALEMASGALVKSRAQIALSITGIAGPAGGSAKKPVGLVYFGMAKEGGVSKSWERHFGEIGRQPIRQAAVEFALELLYEAIPPVP